MDPQRFDSLVRSLHRAATRRGALAALLAGLVAPLLPDPAEGKGGRGRGGKGKRKVPDKGKGKDRDSGGGKGRGQGGGMGRGQGGDKNKHGNKGKNKNTQRKQHEEQTPARAQAVCFGGSPCNPGPSANLKQCDFGSSALGGKDLSRANLDAANLRGADASGANFLKANLGKSCLVDTNLRGARTDGTTNWTGALYCRTTMPNGSINNSGCTQGTPCCPTCDAAHPCPANQVCCQGRCRSGDCCTNAQCTDPSKPICLNNRCAPCTSNQQCGNGKVCCDGQCRSGNCCRDGDCANRPDRPCQRKTCDPATNTCGYTSLDNGTVCDDGDPCTRDDTCQNGSCRPGLTIDCSSEGDACNDGVCRTDGTCGKRPKDNGAACNADNDSCTVGDSCQDGVCIPGAGTNCRNLDDQCNTGVCQSSDGRCVKRPKADDTQCVADGNLCNEVGACRNGSCVAGPAVVCAASDECHVAGVCNPSTGRCSNPNAPDSTSCGAGGQCQSGRCVGACLVTNAVCDPATGTCCNIEGDFCSETANCRGAGEPGRCCRGDGAACDSQCDCCDGTCANGVCCRSGQQCNSSNECCDGEECIDEVCSQVCGTNQAICGDGSGEACCDGFHCVDGECYPNTCSAPDELCSSAVDCCDNSITTCQFSTSGVGACCRPFNQPCDNSDQCCGVRICGPQSRCCQGTFLNPERFQVRGCSGREHECCPGTRCSRTSNACCVEEGQPVSAYRDGFLDCCHFATRDGVCICHADGETCAAPTGNPFLSTCCDGLLCVDNQCQPPCAPWTSNQGGCNADFPCCRGHTCEANGFCSL